MMNKIKKLTTYLLSLLASFLLISNISSATKISGCCDKHMYKEKPSYVLEYDDNKTIDTDSALKDLEKLMLKDKKLNIKILAFANSAGEEDSPEKFKKMLDKAYEIKKHLLSLNIEPGRIAIQIKVFIEGNKRTKDSIRIYENKHKS